MWWLEKKLIGVRDPFGIRPLVIGKLKNSYIFASETCALDIVGARFVREVENGEVVVIENDELTSISVVLRYDWARLETSTEGSVTAGGAGTNNFFTPDGSSV